MRKRAEVALELSYRQVQQKIDELGKSEEELRSSRQQLIDIIDFFPDATFVIDHNRKVIVWNNAMEAMTGVSKAEIIGQGDRAYSLPFYAERRRQLLDLIENDDEALAAKYAWVQKKGRILYAETFCPALYGGKGAYVWATATSLLDMHGNHVGAIESIRDMTDRWMAEEALRKSDARFRSYFNLPLVGIAIMNREKCWVEANDRICDILGYSRQELLHTAWSELTHPEDLAVAQEQFNKVLDGQLDSYTLEKRFIRKNGAIIWASVAVGGVRKQDGTLDYIVALLQDITVRKQAESQRDLLTAAFESTADAIVITDTPDGTIRYVNKAFEQITGYLRRDIIGRSLDLLESCNVDDQLNRITKETSGRNDAWSGRLISKKKDGTLYHEDCTYTPVKNSNGETLGHVSIKRDVTDKMKLESIAQTVDNMNNIGYIFSGVRHEIGNLIFGMTAHLNYLAEKVENIDTATIKKHVSYALEAIDEMEFIFRGLKSFNMFENLELGWISMTDFMNNFLALIREDFYKKGITILVEVQPCAERCHGDPRALQQVLLNLFTNAADALSGRKDASVSVFVSRNGGMVRITIEDNGCGIPEENLKDLFKPFFTTKGHGTGLGLVISKKMIERMNGNIQIKSRQSGGTTVDILLPMETP